jgi:hypothetical protein
MGKYIDCQKKNRKNTAIWPSCDRASLMYFLKYNQQDAKLYNILYYR